ncbi:AAA family ATPase [Sphingobacterium sp. BIGb0116]|uniref:AAA family ATPase n=1 Tax=Sphingobacterium sp. BIGb0116 TaxID=2940619 RepID=UPI002169FED4|nr:AAA family ATPase [Sphingobacterium sp. BIGb0116]MCS4164238.1 ABC-type multidrug transport system ATPase subunit [Sphingobacterium sp. BIGb0116]
MILNITTNYRILKENLGIELPDFVVLTGSNGAGKTQLLSHIYENSGGYWEKYENERMSSMNPDDVQMLHPLIDRKGNILNNIVYSYPGLRNYENYFQSEEPLINQIKQEWTQLEPLCIGYRTIRNKSFESDEHELTELNNSIVSLVKSLQTDSSRFSESSLKKAQLYQIKALKEVSSKSGKEISEINYIDFLIFYNIPTNIFSSALDLLFHQFYLKQKYYPLLTESITAPWDTFNQILGESNFKYKVEFVPSTNEEYPSSIKLVDNQLGVTSANLDGLSSGEKTIIALIFVLYHASRNGQFPQVILFDEPDAHLHPSLTQLFLDVIQKVLVEEQKVKVIITTHSPSTIALAPNDSIYKMDRILGYPIKEDRKSAIEELTNGITSVTVEESSLGIIYNIKNADNHILFTEGITDKIILETAWEKLYPTKDRNFYIQDCFSANFLGALFNQGDELPDGIFHQFPHKTLIALFDFDESGYANWNRKKFANLIEEDPAKCLTRHNNANGYLVLLPTTNKKLIMDLVIKGGNDTFKNESKLTIESLFLNFELLREKFFTEQRVLGGGSYYTFNGKKREFSQYIRSLEPCYFEEFIPLFEKVNVLLKCY